jgi:hypothetical protein
MTHQGLGGRIRLQRQISARAIGAEHVMITRKATVEAQVNRGRTLSDRQYLGRDIEACRRRGKRPRLRCRLRLNHRRHRSPIY